MVEFVVFVVAGLMVAAAMAGMAIGAVAMAQRGVDDWVAAQDMRLLDTWRDDETETRE